MKRTILMTIAVASTLVVTAQMGALLYLSLTGVLTTESLWELQALFEDKSSLRAEEGPVDNGETEFSIEELMRERVVRTFTWKTANARWTGWCRSWSVGGMRF
jgi:hypothetical protein